MRSSSSMWSGRRNNSGGAPSSSSPTVASPRRVSADVCRLVPLLQCLRPVSACRGTSFGRHRQRCSCCVCAWCQEERPAVRCACRTACAGKQAPRRARGADHPLTRPARHRCAPCIAHSYATALSSLISFLSHAPQPSSSSIDPQYIQDDQGQLCASRGPREPRQLGAGALNA